ncbi:MAG: ComF family protein [Caulobacteraceae bacterium]|nr:ComF family protein [Caulobacteraceae bacterium]
MALRGWLGGENAGFLAALKPGARVRAVIGRATDAIFPPHAFDGGARPQGEGLSPEAWTRVRFIEDPRCDGCGTPFEVDPGARCAACQSDPFSFERARAACVYDDASRDLILKFKHGDRTEHAGLFGRWIARSAADLIAEADAVAPVPLHPLRLLSRRFNQAAEIARPLSRTADLEFLPDVVVRTRRTETQGGKSGRGRERNVKGAFSVPDERRKRVKGRRILLIDDVMTTGATLDACARALLAGGARAVDCAVVARVGGGV